MQKGEEGPIVDMPVKMRGYQAAIARLISDLDPRHVEAFMRIEHGTLDALSPERFVASAMIAAKCVREVTPRRAELLAQSYGL